MKKKNQADVCRVTMEKPLTESCSREEKSEASDTQTSFLSFENDFYLVIDAAGRLQCLNQLTLSKARPFLCSVVQQQLNKLGTRRNLCQISFLFSVLGYTMCYVNLY